LNRSFSPLESVVGAATQGGLSHFSDGDREPAAELVRTAGQVRTSDLRGTPSQEVLSELRTLRQLSAGVFSPETNRDSLPEIIIFSLIAALGVAWPIISMVATMAARR